MLPVFCGPVLVAGRMRAHQRRIGAALPVHSGLGLGCIGRKHAGLRRMGIDLDLQEVKDDEGAYDLRQAAEIHERPCAEADQGESMNALRLAGIPVWARFLANVVRIKKEEKGEPLSSMHVFS